MRIAFDSLDTVFGLKPGSSRVSVLENDISGQNAGKGTVEIAGSGTQFTAGRWEVLLTVLLPALQRHLEEAATLHAKEAATAQSQTIPMESNYLGGPSRTSYIPPSLSLQDSTLAVPNPFSPGQQTDPNVNTNQESLGYINDSIFFLPESIDDPDEFFDFGTDDFLYADRPNSDMQLDSE